MAIYRKYPAMIKHRTITTMERLQMEKNSSLDVVVKYGNYVLVSNHTYVGYTAAVYKFVETTEETGLDYIECRISQVAEADGYFEDAGEALLWGFELAKAGAPEKYKIYKHIEKTRGYTTVTDTDKLIKSLTPEQLEIVDFAGEMWEHGELQYQELTEEDGYAELVVYTKTGELYEYPEIIRWYEGLEPAESLIDMFRRNAQKR